MAVLQMPTVYYKQFDADPALEFPGESFGGWQKEMLPLDLSATAVVVMHAWDCGSRTDYPGWHRAVEYLSRARDILSSVFPQLLQAVRESELKLFHVVGSGGYYKRDSGYLDAVRLARQWGLEQRVGLAGEAGSDRMRAAIEDLSAQPVLRHLRDFKAGNGYPGKHNMPDIGRGCAAIDYAAEARPLPGEGVAENGSQLLALCLDANVSHLIYAGFAVNWCMLLEPGGMAEMSRNGLLCSVIPEAVTAVENRESVRVEWAKKLALWRVALAFGFVYELEDFLRCL
ncbi:hypothetical protein [Paenibacillus silvisoli]|uniref:hypothetical protein n=1 Tax=Paenibacillus silvisoli TaxID=3110539 RepID=UPI002803B67B|nr:hypothetical protein [Paenibacillus silvisoli]